jgi:hypothetical protein
MELPMDGLIVAHGNGWDEMMIFFFPIAFGIGFWLITRQKPADDDDEVQAPSAGDPQTLDDR